MRFKKPGQTDKEFHELTGDVKKVMQTTYRALTKAGETFTGDIKKEYTFRETNFVLTFNSAGIITHEWLFGTNGRTEQVYTDTGLNVERGDFTEDGVETQRMFISYNEKNMPVDSCLKQNNGELSYRGIYTYNEKNLLAETVTYGKADALNSRTVYTYTDAGKPLSVIQYSGNGTVKHETHYKYDEHGNNIEYWGISHDEKQKVYDRHTYQKFNDKGDIIYQRVVNNDGSEKEYTYTPEYDSEGKRIIKHRDEDEDDAENKEVILENDSRGNWIKKTTFNNKIPVTITLREILYADEPERELIHPLSIVKVATEQEKPVKKEREKIEPLAMEDAKWITEWAAITPDNFPLQRYYALKFKEIPSLVNYSGPHIEAFALQKELEIHLNAQTIHTYSTVWNGYERVQKYTLQFPHYPGYLLHATGITQHNMDEFQIPDDLLETYDDYVNTSSFQLLKPHENSENSNDFFEEWFREYIDKCSLRKKPERPKINMIEVRGTSFAVVEYPVKDDFIIRDLDVNYGHGFAKFHNDLMQRFTTSKGLVLFHGHPGTGKTFYIRHLLRQMAAKRKNVIYMPPNMVDHLVEPNFMTFLSNEIKRWSHDGNYCVLLIEDAEPLLAKRQEGVRIQGVTNLLNMTDGLLNDMLNLQIICTFNVDLQKLDSALLRPGRLIARKEFKALSVLDANLLAQRLGIKHHFKKPATLGEIYAMQKNHNTLIHDVEQDKGASKAIDDL